MIRWFFHRQINAFERAWNYDAAYLHELIDIDPARAGDVLESSGFEQVSKGHSSAPYCAAGIVAVMAEDCGPCTQLTIEMAERGGVDPAILRAVVARDYQKMPFEVALAVRFTEATLRHAPQADDLREEVIRQWGKRGLVSLSFAMLAARMYPTLKYALGHGKSCTRLTIGGDILPVLKNVSKAA